MRILWQDVRYGCRILARNPGFAILVIAILTIGIGANTAVFSVINTVLLKALPYDDPGKIVAIQEVERDMRLRPRTVSPRTLAYWCKHNQVFDYIAGRVCREMRLTEPGEPSKVSVWAVSSCYFSLVGVPPRLGRGFLPQEEQAGRNHVVVVSQAFWRDRLGGDPQAIGKCLTVEGESCTVVGVMPPGYYDDMTVWVPLVLDRASVEEHLVVWARLKRGVSVERARADMAVLERQLAQADPKSYAGFDVSVERLVDNWLGSERRLLYPLWGAVGLVLLIACMNVAGLFLVHGDARRQEMTLRAMLGASRSRILSQLLTESLLLSLAAGVLGVLAAFWMIKGIVAVCPPGVDTIEETRIDRTVLFFTLGLSVIVGLAFGLLPAWKAGGMRSARALRTQASGPVLDRGWRRLCHGLVVAQIAIALTLLVGVGMLIQSLVLLQREDLGFAPGNVAVMHVQLPESKYPQGPQAALCLRQLLLRVQALPPVRSAAVISTNLYLGSGGGNMPLAIDGRPPDPERNTFAKIQIVSADFFATLGMRILQGRGFTAQEMHGTAQGVLIDESLARRYFSRQDPLGQRIAVGGRDAGPVLGVVSTLKDYRTLNPDLAAVYWPLSEDYCWSSADIVVKTDGDPVPLAPLLRALALDLDKDLEVSPMKGIGETLSAMLAPRRFAIVLMGAFAHTALIVAALGLYGLLQYGVARRTHEIGVRLALGATRGRIIRTVLCQGGWLIALGTGLGLAGGYVMSRIVASLLHKAGPTDPVMLAIVLVTLLVTALGASYVPARRAARVDPMVALRHE